MVFVYFFFFLVKGRLKREEGEKTIGVNSQKSVFCLKIVHNYVFILKIWKIYMPFCK